MGKKIKRLAYKFCNNIDSIQHYLIYCKNTFNYWESFSNWWNSFAINWDYLKFNLNSFNIDELIIFGYYNKNTGGNALILFAKMHMHVTKQIGFL